MRYHLRHFAPTRLVIVAAVLVPVMWIGFRPGGTEVGDRLTLWSVGRYWTVLTPVTVAVLAPLLGTVWRQRTLQRSWLLARPGPAAMVRDGLANLFAGYVPYAAVVAALTAVLAARVAPDSGRFATVCLVTVFGPLVGGYIVLAAGYLAGLLSGSSGVRVAVVVLMAVLDAVNSLPLAALSVSGTASQVLRAGSWTMNFRTDSAAVVGPTAGFLAARVAACVVVTALVAVAVWRRGRPVEGGDTPR